MSESLNTQQGTKKRFFNQPILVLSLFTSMATALTELPFWIIIFALILVVWRLAYEELALPKISVRWTTVIGVFLFIVTYAQYRSVWGQVESAIILLGLISISILNYETERDHRILILLGFILASMKPMFAIDLAWAIPSFFCYIGLWISLIPNIVTNKWRFFVRLSAYSTPLLVILFFLFPRIVIFQSARYSPGITSSGFSEDLNPGRFASLVQTDRSAFFAKFDRDIILSDSLLSNKDLYWRGSILSEGHGFEWKRRFRFNNQKNEISQNLQRKGFSSIFNYSVIMEPMDHRIVFTLDVPSQLKNTNTSLDSSEYSTIRVATPLAQQKQFDFSADPYFISLQDPTTDPVYLEIKNLPPKTKEWVNELNKQNLTVDQKIKALERFFSLSGFRYTLNPGKYEKNDLDDFLFNRKKGFCEHYAAAYTTLARGLKIPARIIIGYQGGEFNSLGGFWKISERDAHAWVEISRGNNWERVDPTTWIAPLRLNISARQFFGLSDVDQVLFSRDSKVPRNQMELAWNQLTHFIDNLNYAWTVFLLEYDKEKQLALLSELLEPDQLLFILKWLGLIFFVFLLYQFIKPLFKRKTRRQVLGEIVIEAEKALLQKNIPVRSSTVSSEILNLIKIHFPDSRVDEFEKIYDQENYFQNQSPLISYFEQKKLHSLLNLK